MTLGHRFHAGGAALLLAASIAAAAACAVALGFPLRLVALAPLGSAALAGALWLSGRAEAARLGSLHVDAEGVRRVRGGGRVVEALRWEEMRCAVWDPQQRQLLFQGPDAATIWCRGPRPWGGIGLERFEALRAELERHPEVPVRPAAVSRRAARRARGAPAPPSPAPTAASSAR